MPFWDQPSNKKSQSIQGSLLKDKTGVSLKTLTPKIENMTLSGGLQGNLQTISFMQKVAKRSAGKPEVRAFATKILQIYQVPSHAYTDEALAIGEFVQKHMRYVRDPRDHELLQDPVMMIEQMEKHGFTSGDCDDMSLLIATLLLSTGHNPRFRAVRYGNKTGNYNHIYVVVYDKNHPGPVSRTVLDAILKDRPIGSEIDHASGDEFEV